MKTALLILSSISTFLRGWPLLLIYALWTAIFAPVAYYMLSIPEATASAIAISAALGLICLLSFCALQGITVFWFMKMSEVKQQIGDKKLLSGIVAGAFRLGAGVALVTFLVGLIGIGTHLLLPVNTENDQPQTFNDPLTGSVPNSVPVAQNEPQKVSKVATTAFWIELIRASILWLVLPLFAMRLWHEQAYGGVGNIVKAFSGRAWRAWAPASIGVGIFSLLIAVGGPVLLLSVGTKVESPILATLLFFVRMGLSWLLPVIGWLLTMAFMATSVRIDNGADSADNAV
ncbi:MAG: hypothetical protein JNN15_14555 [Blastocatellia bacterium]|nr:hypothetical protein [Blastocatellia bacterium]